MTPVKRKRAIIGGAAVTLGLYGMFLFYQNYIIATYFRNNLPNQLENIIIIIFNFIFIGLLATHYYILVYNATGSLPTKVNTHIKLIYAIIYSIIVVILFSMSSVAKQIMKERPSLSLEFLIKLHLFKLFVYLLLIIVIWLIWLFIKFLIKKK